MGTESLESPGLFSPSCPPPSLPSPFPLNWFLVPWLSGWSVYFDCSSQNKSLMKQLVGRAISSRLPLGSGGGAGPETARDAWEEAVARRAGRQSGVRDQSSFTYSLEEGNRAGPPLAVCSLRPEDPTALLNNPSQDSPKSFQ